MAYHLAEIVPFSYSVKDQLEGESSLFPQRLHISQQVSSHSQASTSLCVIHTWKNCDEVSCCIHPCPMIRQKHTLSLMFSSSFFVIQTKEILVERGESRNIRSGSSVTWVPGQHPNKQRRRFLGGGPLPPQHIHARYGASPEREEVLSEAANNSEVPVLASGRWLASCCSREVQWRRESAESVGGQARESGEGS